MYFEGFGLLLPLWTHSLLTGGNRWNYLQKNQRKICNPLKYSSYYSWKKKKK